MAWIAHGLRACRTAAGLVALAAAPSLAAAGQPPGGEGAPAPSDDAGSRHDHDHHSADPHEGMYGAHPMSREVSGTAWGPDSAPMRAIHFSAGSWRMMLHGFATATFHAASGPRGDEKAFSTSMLGLMAHRLVGADGRLGFRLMASLEPSMGGEGYPLLLQTGETADGVTPLIDRQHPHDLLMEVAASYSHAVGDESSLFLYAAPVGEPALGPPAFMHRASGAEYPLAPISHHWLDSTHITYGVVTLGAIAGDVKLEASVFNGREPDEERWGVDEIRLDSFSGRVSFNPSPRWALQLSLAELKSPEQLHPGVDVRRTTASAIFNQPLANGYWQTTLAWGRNDRKAASPAAAAVPVTDPRRPGPPPITDQAGTGALAALLLESRVTIADRHTFFGRWELAEKDELFAPIDTRHTVPFDVSSVAVGYLFDLSLRGPLRVGLGVAASRSFVPESLEGDYGSSPGSLTGFLRVALGREP